MSTVAWFRIQLARRWAFGTRCPSPTMQGRYGTSSTWIFAQFLAVLMVGLIGLSSNVLAAPCSEVPAGQAAEILPPDIERLVQSRLQKIEVAELKQHLQVMANTVSVVDYGTELFGLAGFYNTHWVVRLSGGGALIEPDAADFSAPLKDDDWVGAVGRFNVLMLSAPGAQPFLVPDGSIALCNADAPIRSVRAFFGDKADAETARDTFRALRFSHLWSGFAFLSWLVTDTIEIIGKGLSGSWGWAIIIFGILLKILLLPINIVAGRLQRQVALHQAALEPRIKYIKEQYDGEEAHNLIIACYKEQGISPFYTLKPMVGALIQVPILIAIFNALAEMPQLQGTSFLWIDDLAAPDVIASLPFAIPFLGDTLNLLPLLMTAITIVSTWVFKNRYATVKSLKEQKRNLYLMGGVFLVLFYPFPAAMVLFWAVANLLQFIQQETVRL